MSHSRVEYIPAPIIIVMFSKVIVTGPTEYPNGDLFSTGAPEASWYVGGA